MFVAAASIVQARLAVLGLILALGLIVVGTTARVSDGRAAHAPPVPIMHYAPAERLVLVFIDSLRREVATDRNIMPNLGRLAREGASFDVEPCRDQLTYLCIRAALTGRDDSSLLAISDNFRPDHAGPPNTILTNVASQRRNSVIGANDFHPYRQYLFAEHSLEKADECESASTTRSFPVHFLGWLPQRRSSARQQLATGTTLFAACCTITATVRGAPSRCYRYPA